MGATFFIGYPEDKDLHVTLSRVASDALETLLDAALQEKHPEIHTVIMEMLALDQISFAGLDRDDFNMMIKAVREYLIGLEDLTAWQLYQKAMWKEELEPLLQQDERYQQGVQS